MPDPNDLSTWDLDSLSAEEQELFRSGIAKSGGMSTPEQAAYSKAREANFGSDGMMKAGISDVRSRQAQRLMYSTYGENEVDWSKCTVYDTGYYDPQNNWVPGAFEGGHFYPDDPEASALNGPPTS
jgi:hypothetical protein